MKLVLALLLFSKIIPAIAQCPRASSPNGEAGLEAETELDCALQCKMSKSCFSFAYKDYKEFKGGPNSFASNCLLQTVWDNNFLAQEVLQENEYSHPKMCVLEPGSSDHAEKFIPTPKIDVQNISKSFGFVHRIEFPELNIAKYYLRENYGQYNFYPRPTRLCVSQHGIVGSIYNTAMAQKVFEELEFEGTCMWLAHRKRPENDENGPKSFVLDDGQIVYGIPNIERGEACENFSDKAIANLPYSNGGYLVYDSETKKFEISGDMDRASNMMKKYNIPCEFTGGPNLAQIPGVKVEASPHYGNKGPHLINDNNWALLSKTDGTHYLSLTQKGILVITLPQKYGISKVTMAPFPEKAALEQPRILVSNVKPNIDEGTLGDATKFAVCGTFKYFIFDTDKPFTISCEKCMPVGSYITLQNGVDVGIRLSEISIIGIEKGRLKM